MNKKFKKILVMFVMVLTIMSVGIIKNEIVANAATVGQQLTQPEDGWKRYKCGDEQITYIGEGWHYGSTWVETLHSRYNYSGSKIKFNFTGDKLRLICGYWQTTSKDVDIIIDGKKIDKYVINNGTNSSENILVYEKLDLSKKEHSLELINNTDEYLTINAVDIDENEELKLYNENISTISLDKSSLTLKEGNSKKLTATTTPSALDVEWSSFDEKIAKVDENGKVTGIKEGTCIVTAQIKGTDVKATCEVTVTKEDIVEPEEPSIENGSLYIEMIDGNIKRADKSQIEKFKKWFISRDLDETESPIFKITNAKGNTEYLVHDKVVGFEIRE
ncbi:Ig-like domain-containing protein [Clostridium cagae]|uniref:Ig-like domain-containing protein n=1 Tax=Clostridium cagae TaxID=2080751 RepID=UPI003F75902D